MPVANEGGSRLILLPPVLLFRTIPHDQAQHIQQPVVGKKHGFSLGRLAQLPVKALSGIFHIHTTQEIYTKLCIVSLSLQNIPTSCLDVNKGFLQKNTFQAKSSIPIRCCNAYFFSPFLRPGAHADLILFPMGFSAVLHYHVLCPVG